MKDVKLSKKEVETIKEALDSLKLSVKIRTYSEDSSYKEKAINTLYNIEKIEEKLKGED